MRHSTNRSSSLAFSLIEILAVVAIIGLVVGATAPALSSLSRAADVNRAIAGVAGTLDLARQYAISKNTYCWVVFASQNSAQGARLYAVILGSKDGSNTIDGARAIDLDSFSNYDLSGGSSNLVILNKAVGYPNSALSPLASSPAPPDPAPAQPNSKINFRFAGFSSEAITFLNANPSAQQIVQFNPSGQARVSGAMSQLIELGVKPTKGPALDEQNVAAVQVDGFTGQTQVYRR